MRFKSSGLGEKEELKGYMSDLSPEGEDLLVFHIQTTDPVKWHLRAGMQFNDVSDIFKGIFKPSILFFIIRSIFYLKKNPKEPEEF